MDASGNYRYDYQYQLQLRRLRLMENILEDYQVNIRHALQLINSERMSSTIDEPIPRNNTIRNNVYSDILNTDAYGTIPQNNMYTNNLNPILRNTQVIVELDTSSSGLSATQIENETQSIIYDASMNSDRCPITWDLFEGGQSVIRINRCGHIFGETALRNWFRTHSNCPVCRVNLVGTGSRMSGNTAASRYSTSTSNDAMVQLFRALLTGMNDSSSDSQ